MTTATRLMTAEEFHGWCQRPENVGKQWELERGEVVEVGRPGELHGVVCVNVVWVLSAYVRQRRKGYVCGNDTGVVWERDPDTMRGPDVFLYDENRRLDELNPKYSERVPRLVVEVLSPTDRVSKVNRRITQFLQWGVPLVWLVDPEERAITVYRYDRPPRVLDENAELVGEELLPDFRCPVADLFFMPGEEEKQPSGESGDSASGPPPPSPPRG